MRAIFVLLFFFSITASANDAVWIHHVNKPVESIYKAVYKSLEDANLFVVFEPDIGKNISQFSKRWGEDYNRNGLQEIRSMIFCNGWYANQVSNADPDMLALCPLHITLIEKEGRSKILFIRPSYVAKGSNAEATAAELENKVINAVKAATSGLADK